MAAPVGRQPLLSLNALGGQLVCFYSSIWELSNMKNDDEHEDDDEQNHAQSVGIKVIAVIVGEI